MLPQRDSKLRRFNSARRALAGRRRKLRLECLETRRVLAVYNVNSFVDSVDANPGDGIAQDLEGRTTLRAAIMEANARAGTDVVTLPNGTYQLTLNGIREDGAQSGDLDITDSISILGINAADTIIDASSLTVRDRVLHVLPGAPPTTPVVVSLQGLTVTGGYASGINFSDFQDFGGGARFDNYTNVTLVDTIWKANSAPRVSGNSRLGVGGAIWSGANLTIAQSRFESNSSSNSGGALYVGSSNATTAIQNSTFILNTSNGGGAIENHQPMTIDRSTFTQNSGGTMAGSGNGGAINHQQSTLVLTNSTISNNLSPFGGGIISYDTMRISSSTIVNNVSAFGGGIFGNATIENSIIAKNTATSSGPDVNGTFTSLGNNLVGNPLGGTGFGASDLLNLDPLVGPLANNGGFTLTHALLAGSPALDAAAAATSPTFDQRGLSRPQGTAPDIGAFELFVLTNRAPVANNDNFSVTEDFGLDRFSPGVLANDVDLDGNVLSAMLITVPQNGTIALRGNGSFTYVPRANFSGTDSFTYKVNDGLVDSNVATVFITVTPVNDPPAFTSLNFVTNEDTSFNSNLGVVDVDGDSFSVALFSNSTRGVTTVNSNGSFSYTPSANFFGSDRFVVVATDSFGAARVATISIQVASVNDAPIANNDSFSVNEDSQLILSSVPVQRLMMTSEPGDWVGAGQTYDLSGPPYTFTPSKNFLNGLDLSVVNGSLNWTLNFAAPFSALLAPGRYQNATRYGFNAASAPGLNVSGNGRGQNRLLGEFTVYDIAYEGNSITRFAGSFVQQGQVAIANILEPPLKGTVRFNSTIGTGAGTSGNDTDIEGDMFTTMLVSGPANGTLSLNLDGSLIYTPNPDFAGIDLFTYRINDGISDSAVATVTITVNNLNDVPIANDDTASTLEDQPVDINVLANDTDADRDALTIISTTGPTQINLDGTIRFTPSANFNGVSTFTYTVSDGRGGLDTAVVSMTVSSVNDAPDAVNDDATTSEDTPITISVLANDFDVDGDSIVLLSATGPTTINSNGTITYTPPANFFGTATFTYTVSDSQGGTDTAVVTVAIAPVNDAPTAVNDSTTTRAGVPATISVLANDLDVDGDTLTVMSATGPTRINSNGSITYTPAPFFAGQDSFTYVVSDGRGRTATGTVAVTVTQVTTTGVTLTSGVLRILGTNSNDQVFIRQVGSSTLRIEASFLASRIDYPLSSVSFIVAHLFGGNDRLEFVGYVAVPAILDGGAGDDTIRGGDGRDIIIGGLGADKLYGLQSEDIIIAGTTSYDSNDAALLALSREWTSTRSLTVRVSSIRNGAGTNLAPGGIRLRKLNTVFDDTSVDQVFGGNGSDWLFYSPSRDLTDLSVVDIAN